MIILALMLMSVFIALSLLHFYWLFGGRIGLEAALPEVEGKAVFIPSAAATLSVAILLGLCALLIGMRAELLAPLLQNSVSLWLTRALAVVLLLRAIGDFRYVGFFKRIRNGRFATMDTLIYAPLCLFLALGIVGLEAL